MESIQTSKKTTSRQTNIELCRIISIVMVVLLHSDFAVFGWPSTWVEPKMGLLALESFCIIGVNVFVLISGYFSIKLKKQTFIKLFYICIFCALIKIIFDIIFEGHIHQSNFLFISKSNWFIPCYIALILFSPMLNSLCERTSKKELGVLLLLLFTYETYFGFFPAQEKYSSLMVGHGISLFHFAFLYLLARYIRIHGIPNPIKKFGLIVYCICSLLIMVTAFILIKTENQSFKIGDNFLINQLYDYSNPLVILSSVGFLIFFVNIKIKKLGGVNYLAQSVLSLLILHTSKEAFSILSPQYRFIYNYYDGVKVIFFWLITIMIVCILCILIDQIRLFSFKLFTRLVKKKIQ